MKHLSKIRLYPKSYDQKFYFTYNGINYEIWHYGKPSIYVTNGKEKHFLGYIDKALYENCTYETISYLNKDSVSLYEYVEKLLMENQECKMYEHRKIGDTPTYGSDLFEPKLLKHKIAHTSYSIDDILGPNYFKGIDYDVYLNSYGINLQRPFVWSGLQEESFILSMLNDANIPPFAIVLHEHNFVYVIDGKQRINAIKRFIDGKFTISHENYEGKIVQISYNELNSSAKRKISRRSLDWNVIYSCEDDKPSDDELIEWFRRINFAGTPQEKSHFDTLLDLQKYQDKDNQLK